MKKNIKFYFFIFFIFFIVGICNISYALNLDSNEYKVTTKENVNYVIGIYPNTQIKTLRKNLIANTDIKILDNNGKIMSEEETISTGNKIQIENTTYIAIVCGDVNGDGKVNVTDLVQMKKHFIGKEILNKTSAMATDIDTNGKLTSTDVLNLKRLIVNIIEESEIYEKDYENNQYGYTINTLTNETIIKKIINNNQGNILQIPNKIDGNNVKEIDDFLGENSKITKVTIPTGIELIGTRAFSELTNLENIEVSGLNENYSSKDGILYNKGKDKLIFYPNGKEEKEYIIEQTVKNVGSYAFYKNNKIERLYIPDTVEEIENNAFKEMKGKVYIKYGAKIEGKLQEKGINYEIDKIPEIIKLNSQKEENQTVSINISASDDIGIVAWSVGLKGSPTTWNNIEMTKNLETSYKNIKVNGTYEAKIKDSIGNIKTQEIIINEIDTSIPKINSIKIIEPTTGTYKKGQKIIVRVQFSEIIKGEAPTLNLSIGNNIVTAQPTELAGNLDYIDYTYTIEENQNGKVEIQSYVGGNITDLSGNKASIVKMTNSGNNIEVDTTAPQIESIKIISPSSGVYKAGQKIVIRVQFSEIIKGTPPVLKLRVGEDVVKATETSLNGTTNYIDYNYTILNYQEGIVEIEDYFDGKITDIAENEATIYRLSNTGNYIEIDTTIPKLESIRIISPSSGEYNGGQKLVIRVQFNKKIQGIAPTLRLRIGNSIAIARGTNPDGRTNYIDYTYVTTKHQSGKVEIESYTGGLVTDLQGNKVNIFKLYNTGSTIIIKPLNTSTDDLISGDIVQL